jgi:SAM-dependent methyltransferase
MFYGEGGLRRAQILGGYESKTFRVSHMEKSYLTQVLQPFVETVRQIGRTGRVLDLGSGRGETARFFRQSGLQQVAQVDLSKFALKRAKGARILTTAEKTPFKDETFDAIHMKDTLVHVGDLNGQFEEIARLLVPGGRVLITSPFFTTDQNSFRVLKRISGRERRVEWIDFDTPNDYENNVRLLSQDRAVIQITPPLYPYSPDRIKASAVANGLFLKQESSWSSTTDNDWYEFSRKRFVLEFAKR